MVSSPKFVPASSPAGERVDARVKPVTHLAVLSQHEIGRLADVHGALRERLRACAIAVLNCGSELDDATALLERFHDFEIEVLQEDGGICLDLRRAPASAFVDGRMIAGIREHLFAVLRDVVYAETEIRDNPRFDPADPGAITGAVFDMLRNAGLLHPAAAPNLAVCWGGHAISRVEYDYSKEVGYQLGLRGVDICTGCGPGAMKGPMKGATIGHAKQHRRSGRYVGISEPGIVAAESPNPIVNELVVMPDIEKRLEAFVRLGHAFVVFPGGVGTVEEILFLLGVVMNPLNADVPFPLILTGPPGSRAYFERLDAFLVSLAGAGVRAHYQIVVGDAEAVARAVVAGVERVSAYRRKRADASYFNWRLVMAPEFQQHFEPTHAAMAGLRLYRAQPRHELLADLRRAFSGIVAGNVKASGIERVRRHGPFELSGDADVLSPLDDLLASFVAEGRMRLPGNEYHPCYRFAA